MPLHFQLSSESRTKLYDSILRQSHPDPEYWAMLGLAGLIALFGLLQNSTAVIIGAMLISPLMNPLLSAALALILGDGNLGTKSATVLGASVTAVILTTWVVTSLSPLKELTPEIAARTHPNLLDLFIAFLSGLAGTLALRGGSTMLTIIPGVAIAVAVIPPLAVVGYGLSLRSWPTAGGAFLLFMTNLVAIALSAALVFRLMGFRPHEETQEGHLKLKYRLGVSVAILAVLSIPLVRTLVKAAAQIRLRSEIVRVLDPAFKTEHSSVTAMTFAHRGDVLRVHATIHTSQYFETPQIEAARESLRKALGSDALLDVDQILVAHGDVTPQRAAAMASAVMGGVVKPVAPAEPPPFDFKTSTEGLLANVQGKLDELLTGTPLQRNGPLGLRMGGSQPAAVNARFISPMPIESQAVNLLASQLGAKLGIPVEIHGEAEISGAEFGLTLEGINLLRGFSPMELDGVRKLAARLQEQPGIRMLVLVTADGLSADEVRAARAGRQLVPLLARSGLKTSDWELQVHSAGVAPPVAAEKLASVPEGGAPQTAARPVPNREARFEFRLVQDF
ncbi:MAG: TIGR00341 family protein [Terriglobia bacterium]